MPDPQWSTLDLFRDWSFYWPTLATAAALAVACAVLGLFVLLRREALVALALPEAVVAGASVAMLLHTPNRLPYAFAGLAAALVLIAWARNRRHDYLLPALYVAGLCIPFLVIAQHGQAHLAELQHLLIGYDVTLVPEDAYRTVPVVLVAALLCAALWRRWLLLAQAPDAARLARLYPFLWDLLFLALLGTVVLMGTGATGVVMVLALLFLPAATALPWARRIPAALLLSTLVGVADVAVAFDLSNRLNWPLSHSIGGVGFAALLLSTTLAALFKR